MIWGLPTEPLPLGFFAFALLVLVLSWRADRVLRWGSTRLFVAGCAIVSAVLSAVWVFVYLRGGPRIIDATAYWLQARALSHGQLHWELDDPEASFAGRFLVRDTQGANGEHVAGIFPPGYPLYLAVGFVLGAPMIMGPVLAALLTAATAGLAREAARFAAIDHVDLVARGAALLAMLSGALRYHTADTMSHGLSAVCVATALAAALRLRASSGDGANPQKKRIPYLVIGVAWGWLIATRPVSGVALGLSLAIVLGFRGLASRRALLIPLAASPFLALFILHQHAATGAWLTSSQSLYYAVSDGPANCFRYGFGQGIGCRLEHGDFVAHNLEKGYGGYAALATTARRLKAHGVDALNAEPLALLLVLPAFLLAIRTPRVRRVALAIAVFILAYAPFYFDGNYPGGGARFFADVLPVELMLVVWLVVARLVPWAGARWGARVTPARAVLLLVALSALGFAFRAHNDHAMLRDREGGRPMFERRVLDENNIDKGLVLVDTDHGYLLGLDPGARADRGELEVARYRGDDIDYFLWVARNRPRVHRYVFDFQSGHARVEPFEPQARNLIEAESLWPPRAQQNAYATRAYPSCTDGNAVLWITPGAANASETSGEIALSLPRALAGKVITPRVVLPSASSGLVFEARVDGAPNVRRTVDAATFGIGCARGPTLVLPPLQSRDHGQVLLVVSPVAEAAGVDGAGAGLDSIEWKEQN